MYTFGKTRYINGTLDYAVANVNGFYLTRDEALADARSWAKYWKYHYAAFGSAVYSREELVAEMGSAMVCNAIGISTEKAFRNSVAYLQSWIDALKSDKRMIVWAAGRAEKAVRYMFGEVIENENN